VYPGSYRCTTPAVALVSTLALTVLLAGCAGGDFDSGAWFSKPLNPFGHNLGYSYSQLGEATQKQRPITANDLVDANGACPGRPAPAPVAGAAAGSGDGVSQLSGGVGVGMSECDVVARIGAPNAVNLSRAQTGERLAILTFNGGPRPGIYRFVAGRLKEMDAVQPPPPPDQAKNKSSKKSIRKSAKKKRPPRQEDNG